MKSTIGKDIQVVGVSQAITSKAQSVVRSDAPGFTEVVRWSAKGHSTDQKGVSPGSFAGLTTFNLDL